MEVLITIFTPTYNRAKLLARLYNSLVAQKYKNFEWLIVDDGSVDNTAEVIRGLKFENKININYIKDDNKGKHIAINWGVKEAKGELFFIVDSDDWLPEDALTTIITEYKTIQNDQAIIGIVGKRNFQNEDFFSYEIEEGVMSSFEFNSRYKLGDMAEVFKTSLLKRFAFPFFEGENFCTEALIWNRISRSYSQKYINKFLCNCEYQRDGLSSKYWQLLLNNPKGSLLYYKELLDFPLSRKSRTEAVKVYNTIAKHNGVSKIQVLQNIGLLNFIYIYK